MGNPAYRLIRVCVLLAGMGVLTAPANAQSNGPSSKPAPGPGMTFLFHDDPAFLKGLRQHGMLRDFGFRVHNTGLDTRPFGERWQNNPLLERARQSGKSYYIDRIAGGMPFQSLKGIEDVAAKLKGDPRFLGFQLHEWGNAPIHDYKRIQELFLKKGLPFDREHFGQYEGRTESPFFGGGDFSVYEHVHRPLNTQKDVEEYLQDYFRRMSKLTNGELMAVNGYYQLYHMGLKLGARNVMAEIGHQVPLTALQIACVRGAARQHGKPFGVYYEPWGGAPFGCPCAIGWSPWFPGGGDPNQKLMGYRIRPELGSSRSLQRRLLYYSWLSGASWCAEEWGVENYFSDWKDYPLTEYGKVVKEFIEVTSTFGPAMPIVPAALVLPAESTVIDVRYVATQKEQLYEMIGPDELHVRLKHFAQHVLGTRPYKYGNDDFNLTPLPWIGSFDVLSADAPADMLQGYRMVVYFDEEQAKKSAADEKSRVVYTGRDEDTRRCIELLDSITGCHVEGEVGCARATMAGGAGLIGLFNNIGVLKKNGKETTDPAATRQAVVHGIPAEARCVVGGKFKTRREADRIELTIPAGEVVVVQIPDGRVLHAAETAVHAPQGH